MQGRKRGEHMKKILAIGVALTMFALFTPAVIGEDSEIITVTMEPSGTIDIALNETEWNVSSLGTNHSKDFNVTNEGTVNVQVNISCEQTSTNLNNTGTGDTWSFGSVAAHDVYNMTVDGTLLDTEVTLAADMVVPGQGTNYTEFTLHMYMPTSSSTSDWQQVNVTLTATAN